MSLPNLSLIETPNITPGDWFLVAGVAGREPAVVGVDLPENDQVYVELATVWNPAYTLPCEELRKGASSTSPPEPTHLSGDMNQNGLLMAGAPGLLQACQTLLKSLYDDRQRLIEAVMGIPDDSGYPGKMSGPSTMRRIQEQINILEPAITRAVVFPQEA